jgi:hypothetical protein
MASSTVYEYRLFCITENKYYRVWGTIPPVVCPNVSTDTIDSSTITVVDQIAQDQFSLKGSSKDSFENLEIFEKTTLIVLKSFNGLCEYRNSISIVSDATISTTSSEFLLASGTTSTSSVTLTSKECGRYNAGRCCEVGIGVRIPVGLSGTQTLKFGYFDTNNGYYFKIVGSVLQVCILRAGTELAINKNAWTGNTLDNLDLSVGAIFVIRFAWYGYGPVQFILLSGGQNILMHTYQTAYQTSIETPNLPINVILDNGEVANTSKEIFISGRQYSVLGSYREITRANCVTIYGSTISSSYTRILSLQKKTGFTAALVKLKSMSFYCGSDCTIEIYTNVAVSSSFTNIPLQNTSETCVEYDPSTDDSLVNYTKAVLVWQGVAFSGISSTVNLEDFKINIYDTPIVVRYKSYSSTPTGTITYSIYWDEGW